MKISAFTFVRNAVSLDYPAREAITSLLPLVDEFVINVGTLGDEPDDGTLALVKSIESPKIRILQSQWNPLLKGGGYVYAQQTNIALLNCTGHWAIYVQCDEILHEEDHDLLREAMNRYGDDHRVDGLSARQINFFRDYDKVICVDPYIRRRKAWIVKPHHFVLSRGDAASFAVLPKYKERGRKLRIMETAARQYHYGAVKNLTTLRDKLKNTTQFWEGREEDAMKEEEEISYQTHPRSALAQFTGSHPAIMAERIRLHEPSLDLDSPKFRTELTFGEKRQRLKGWLADKVNDRFISRSDYHLLGRHSVAPDLRDSITNAG
ncbi:MAG: hypothetical protein AAF191_05960 [Verrucomicrobiota bacterium]